MKPEASDAGLAPLRGNGIGRRLRWHVAMKHGVEYRDLGNSRPARTRDSDSRDAPGGLCSGASGLDDLISALMEPLIRVASRKRGRPVGHAVSYCFDTRHPRFEAPGKRVENGLDFLFLIGSSASNF